MPREAKSTAIPRTKKPTRVRLMFLPPSSSAYKDLVFRVRRRRSESQPGRQRVGARRLIGAGPGRLSEVWPLQPVGAGDGPHRILPPHQDKETLLTQTANLAAVESKGKAMAS